MEGDIRNALTRIEGTLRRHTQLLEDIMSGEDDLKQRKAEAELVSV